jgi:tetratricopeptide (TPR) repeat protein/predicted Ser/Thr protein kinase
MSAAAGALDSSRYRIVRLLGRGGLGEVYLARDLTLGRDVAIKFVAPDKVADTDARRRLLREARAAAALDHPGICTVYEAGENADGRGFIVMQYVEGQTLAAVLSRGAMPIRDALTLCVQIAEALAAAHRRGVVHRDLKPGNVMVTPSGHAKLVDFGIAKILQSQTLRDDDPTATVTTTATGHSLIGSGTPAYMSPEQIQQRPVDGRSDLFCLGLVLFECLTGRRAFGGRTSIETMANILHVESSVPSGLRPELTEGHDELCRRLLAKDPADRFQSAEEVVGAIRLLLPDTSRTPGPLSERTRTGRGPVVSPSPPRPWLRPAVLAAATVVLIGVAGGAWFWNRGGGLPRVPPESDVWYQRGTEAIREGAYHSGRKALQQAVAIFPQHVLAYARLAEADAELDDPRTARDHLLRVSQLAPDESRLPAVERLRLQALRALVLRDVDTSIALYRQLVTLDPEDSGAWLDLGRAQQAAGLQTDARASYERAIERDRQSAVAYLRLGHVEALQSRRDEALAAFREAERLYKALSDVEGETEVLLNRGGALDALGEFKAARIDLERALRLSTEDSKSIHQQVRTQLSLSSVTASEGNYAESERMASAAVQEALANGLDAVAAGGLVDLAATLMNDSGRPAEAERHAQRAIALAEQRGARATAARARVQLASVLLETNRAKESLDVLGGVLPFLKANQYRRYELLALSIASRAHERLDELDQARQISSDVLAVAEAVKDDGQVALAASNLASVLTSLGRFPEALRLRERAEAIHRRQGDKASLPYDLTNRADLLIRLGRRDEAEKLLAELDEGIAAGIGSYAGRKRRATFLRALAAATALHCEEALPLVAQFEQGGAASGAAGVLAPAVADFCSARLGRRAAGGSAADAEPGFARERHYWIAAAALQRQDAKTSLAEITQGLAQLGTVSNDELRWRLAAVGALAARRLGDAKSAGEFDATARRAIEQLRSAWKADFEPYARRPDITDLRNRAGQG